ncbi:SSI family serine proteinase inhibitor [Streptomyces klenkii]
MRFHSTLTPVLSAVATVALATTSAAATGNNCPAPFLKLSSAHTGISPHSAPETTVLLGCNPPRGTHKNPSEACGVLERAKWDLKNLKAEDSPVCTMEYSPVTVSADGELDGHEIHWTHTYDNSCLMLRETNNLFPSPPRVPAQQKETGSNQP